MKATLEKFHQDSNIQLQVHAILTKISEWESRVPLSRIILSIIKWLKTDLQKQGHSDRFFLTLETLLFKGTVHCEACLASFLPSFIEHSLSDSNKYKDMQGDECAVRVEGRISSFYLFSSADSHFFLIDRAMGRLLERQNIVAHVVGHFSASWWKGLEKMLLSKATMAGFSLVLYCHGLQATLWTWWTQCLEGCCCKILWPWKSEGVGQFLEIDAGLLQTPCQSTVLRVVGSLPMNSPIPHNVTLLVWVIRWLFIHFVFRKLAHFSCHWK